MTDFVDPYFDPRIGDLHNLLGATSPAELRALEPQAVFASELELPDVGIARSDDLTELCAVHAQQIDWDEVVGDENDRASRAAAEDEDRTLLFAMLKRIVEAV